MGTFSCSSCQMQLAVKDEHAGRKVKCPRCGNVLIAPALGANDGPPSLPPAEHQNHNPVLTQLLAPAQAAEELGRLGRYRVLSILGHGGMGVVYKAEDSLLKRLVALKAILPALGADADVRKRFLREAQTMAVVEHDHIVRLYEVGEDRGVPFIAMEFLMGESLEERLEREAHMPLGEVVRIGREIAEGLTAAHGRGLIHRDIKPANIWLESPRGRIKILDFGIARAVNGDARLTKTGAVLGTPDFMAPEQARGERVDFRCDLFSLGVVIYRLTTGKNPFYAKDALSTLVAITTETPTPPQVQNFDVPIELSDLIMKLLEKAPAKRGESAHEVAEALQQIEGQLRGEEGASFTKHSGKSPPLIRATRPKDDAKRRLRWVILAVVLAVGCLAGAVFALLR